MRAKPPIARRIGIGVIAVCATLLTASCAAGKLAATSQETPAIDGTTGHLGTVQLHAVAITAPSGPCVLPGADAALSFVIVNTGRHSDSLQGVSSPRFASSASVASADDLASYTKTDAGSGSCDQTSGAPNASGSAAPTAGASLPPGAGVQTVRPAQALQLGVYNAGTNAPGTPTAPIIVLRGLRKGPLFPGESVPVTFSFAKAGTITLRVPVQLSAAPNKAAVPSVTEKATEAVN